MNEDRVRGNILFIIIMIGIGVILFTLHAVQQNRTYPQFVGVGWEMHPLLYHDEIEKAAPRRACLSMGIFDSIKRKAASIREEAYARGYVPDTPSDDRPPTPAPKATIQYERPIGPAPACGVTMMDCRE